MAKAGSKGAWTPLAAQYYLDDAILEVGPDAELLWVRVLSFLASVHTDGFITDRQLRSVGFGLRGLQKRITALTNVGLLVTLENGFEARSWHKWNKTTQERNQIRARDRERKARKVAEEGLVSGRIPNAFQTESEPYITEQNRTLEKSKDLPLEAADASPDDDFQKLCELLVSLIVGNGDKAPAITKQWHPAARLLIEKDGRDIESAARVMRWALADSFWKGNIRSMPTFREKYDQLRHAANRDLAKKQAARRLSNAEIAVQEYQAKYGGGHDGAGSAPALDPGVGN